MSSPTPSTIKRLLLRSGNRCAFPGCNRPLVEGDVLVAEVCHICGEKPGAARYNPSQTEAERQAYDNLIVLCPTHHTIIDGDERTYTVDALHEMKRAHEAKAGRDFVISDELTNRIMLFLGGAGLGAAIGTGVQAILQPKETLLNELSLILRYAPKGLLQYFSCDELRLKVGEFLLDVFRAAGWRIEKLEHEPRLGSKKAHKRPFMLMLFLLPDSHQVSNARQAIDEVFRKCGFTAGSEADEYEAEDKEQGRRIKFLLAIGARK
jgi:hypothetical protein